MAPRVSDLQAQISTLTQELELSTFLNKGILTTNSEHKVRIAELETENAALRAAERRLTATEDALEEAEKKCRAYERERIAWEREVEKERQARVGVENELEEAKGRLEDLDAYWRSVREGLDARFGYGEKKGESSTAAGRSAGGKGLKGDSMSKDGGTTSRSTADKTASHARRSSGRDVRTPRYTEPDDDDEFEHASTSPVLAPSAPSTHRKRRRVETSPSDLGDDIPRVVSRSASPLPVRAAQPRRSVAKEPENKKRDAKTQTSITIGSGGRNIDKKATPVAKPTKRPSASKHIRRVSDDLPMKVEPISPGSGRPDKEDEVDDSDADPLAME